MNVTKSCADHLAVLRSGAKTGETELKNPKRVGVDELTVNLPS
jgi:hypothetical protein